MSNLPRDVDSTYLKSQEMATRCEAERPVDSAPASTQSTVNTVDPDTHRLVALDGIRGIAVLAVMMSHFESVLPDAGFFRPIKSVAIYGWAGVDLFFVLSGFLITGVLLSTRTATNYFGSFYARRILRIFPIYFLTLAFMFSISSVFPGMRAEIPPSTDRIYYYFFLENWLAAWRGTWPPNALGHFWSLAVEEQFYAVWPVVVLLFGIRFLKPLVIALIMGALALRTYWLVSYGISEGPLISTATRCDGLLFGALAAVIFARGRSSTESGLSPTSFSGRLSRAALASLVAVFAISALFGPSSVTFFAVAFTLISISFASIVLYLGYTDGMKIPIQTLFSNPSLRRVGKYSYGMYVYHVPLFWLSNVFLYRYLPVGVKSNPAFAIGYGISLIGGTYIIAMLSYEHFESRFLSLKRYFRAAF